jgi:hypothetical protein
MYTRILFLYGHAVFDLVNLVTIIIKWAAKISDQEIPRSPTAEHRTVIAI